MGEGASVAVVKSKGTREGVVVGPAVGAGGAVKSTKPPKSPGAAVPKSGGGGACI